jgi:soluble lytic murein transglycosylase-like protein
MGESLSALYLRDPETAAILRRQAMAQNLARAQNPEIMYRSAASPWVAALQSVAGNLGAHMAERDLTALTERRDGEANEWRSRMMAGLLGGQAPNAPAAPAAPQTAPARMGGAAIPAVQREDLPPAQAPADLAPLIAEASRETGIPEAVLTAKIRQESNFRPDAVGRAGEVGLAQIMPATARQPGFGMQGVDPATLRDPRENILFGARYLAARGRAAGVTDWNDPAQVDRALAAYNGGGDPNYVQNVRRWMPQGAATPAAMPASAPAQPGAPAQAPGAPAGVTREALVPMIMDGMNSRNPRIREEAQRMAQVAQLLPQPSSRNVTTAAPGSALIDPRTGQVVGQIPQAPGERERLMEQYGRLVELGENVNPAQRAQRDALAAYLRGAPPQIGSIPPGFQVTQQPDGTFTMRPIPGSPAERQERDAARAEGARQTGTQRTGNIVLQDIGRVERLLDTATLPVAGTGATTLSQLPGTAASDARALLESIRANVGFAQLNQMRAESPTGGALGQVTERETALLQAVLGSLEQSQSPRQFRQNLVRLHNVYLDIVHGPGQGPPRRPTGIEEPGQPPAGARPNDAAPSAPAAAPGIQAEPPASAAPVRVRTPEEARRLPSGTPIILPDGSRGRVP